MWDITDHISNNIIAWQHRVSNIALLVLSDYILMLLMPETLIEIWVPDHNFVGNDPIARHGERWMH